MTSSIAQHCVFYFEKRKKHPSFLPCATQFQLLNTHFSTKLGRIVDSVFRNTSNLWEKKQEFIVFTIILVDLAAFRDIKITSRCKMLSSSLIFGFSTDKYL